MAYLDFMAFAKGAEQANQANWADTMRSWQVAVNDLNARTGEEKLRQLRSSFDMGQPLEQAKIDDQLTLRAANIDSAGWETSSLKKWAQLADPAQRDAAQVGDIQARIASLDPGNPADLVKKQNLERYVLTNLVPRARAENRLSAVPQLLGALGITGGQAEQQTSMWSNPAGVDDKTILEAGGVPEYGARDRNGRSVLTGVHFGGQKRTPQEFQQIMATRSAPFGATTPTWGIGASEAQRGAALRQVQQQVDTLNERDPLHQYVMFSNGQVQVLAKPSATTAPVAAAPQVDPVIAQQASQVGALEQQVKQLQAQIAQMSTPAPAVAPTYNQATVAQQNAAILAGRTGLNPLRPAVELPPIRR